MNHFAGNLDYTLVWPHEPFVRELRRLLDRATTIGLDPEVVDEIEHFLTETFESSTPSTDFRARIDEGERPSKTVIWLNRLALAAPELPTPKPPLPYFSQKQSGPDVPTTVPLHVAVVRIRELIQDFKDKHYFAREFGYACYDRSGDVDNSPQDELKRRVGKPQLWTDSPESWHDALQPSRWEIADVCDFVEVFHDLASRPTSGWYHSFNNCGWHPEHYFRPAGQHLYRCRMNELLGNLGLDYRLAERGEDTGRMVQAVDGELGGLIDEALESEFAHSNQLAHAVALFRKRDSTDEDKRSAVVSLAGILEEHRQLLDSSLLSKDEGALFHIANQFNLRHQRADQYKDYAPEFLDWIFYWYLATTQLVEKLVSARNT